MAWTVAQVISEFRDLTGRKSTGQLSDAAIVIRANQYWQDVFPYDVKFQVPELELWHTFNTVDGDGDYNLSTDGSNIIRVGGPAYVDDNPADLWTDVERFHDEYPHDYETEDRPTDILLFGRVLYLRPIPDDIYEVRIRKTSRPTAWVSTDTITPEPAGPCIAYGSAVMYLSSQGERDIAEEHVSMYNHFLGAMRSYIIKQIPVGRRPRGGRF